VKFGAGLLGHLLHQGTGGTPAGPFSLSVAIPNSAAKVFLPAIAGAHITEDGNPVEAQQEGGSNVMQVGSGSYSFEMK